MKPSLPPPFASLIRQIRWLLLITSLSILLPLATGLFWYIERESGIQTLIHNSLIDLETTHTAITELSELYHRRITERSLPLPEEPLSQQTRHHLRAVIESLNALDSPNRARPSEELNHVLQRTRSHISQINQAQPRLQQETLDRSLESLRIDLLQIRLLVRELHGTNSDLNPKKDEGLRTIQIPATLGLLLLGIGVSGRMFGEIRNAAHNDSRAQQNLTTRRNQIETQVLQSLHEKETLLREIHHRVKNNMQVISSLLYFQEKKAHDPTSASVFSECRTRLRSMILVHEKLYRAENLSQIRFDDYIRSLIEQIHSTHASSQFKASLQIELNPVYLPIEIATPAGMIVCELITNIFKYAFPDQHPGEATIRLLADKETVRIIVSDNGVGLPLDIDTENPTSFGWRLICALRNQLNATTRIDRNNGTSVTLTFPAPPQPSPPAPPSADSSVRLRTQTIATTPATR